MFFLTASAHWGKRRADLIRIVPNGLPRPDLLLVPPLARPAAIGLAFLLLAVFPANVRAAREGITIGGKPATPLVARSLIQGIFLIATVVVAIGSSG